MPHLLTPAADPAPTNAPPDREFFMRPVADRDHEVRVSQETGDLLRHDLGQVQPMTSSRRDSAGCDAISGMRAGTDRRNLAHVVPQRLRELRAGGVRGADEHDTLCSRRREGSQLEQSARVEADIRPPPVALRRPRETIPSRSSTFR